MALSAYAPPLAYAIFLWWFSTGVIFALYKHSSGTMRRGFLLSSIAMVVGMIGIIATRNSNSQASVYLAVTCGVMIWAWQMAGYYMGFITGPRLDMASLPTQTQDEPLSFTKRFWLAMRFGLYHELSVLALGVVLVAITWQAANPWGLWIYVALGLMHTSAKLNVFFGVRNFRLELLPPKMHQVGPLLGQQRHNILFPISVLLATSCAMALVYQATLADVSTATSTGYLLVATLVGLGLVEHWLLVLPLPAAIWGLVIHHQPLAEPESIDKAPTVLTDKTPTVIKGSAQ